jgi:hypothetical protein
MARAIRDMGNATGTDKEVKFVGVTAVAHYHECVANAPTWLFKCLLDWDVDCKTAKIWLRT